MRQDSAGWLDLHTRTELIIGKHLVSDDLDPLSHDFYLRPRVNVEDVIDRVGLRAIGLTKERYLGKQPILLLVAFAQPVECAGDTLRGDQVVRVNFSDILDLRN